jgi:5-methylcytosine-specific restriction endonuclease McrA
MTEKKLTIDHVVPISKGGQHTWTNVVTACSQCNNRKGDKTPAQVGFQLLNDPEHPQWLPSRELSYKTQHLPQIWQTYLWLNNREPIKAG